MGQDLGPPLRLAPLLQALGRHGVDFVVVGGVAGLAHGSAYPTYDLDVAYARDDANLERMAAALRDLGVELRNAAADLPFQLDAQALTNGSNFNFKSEHGNFDILGDIDGIRSYGDLRAAARVERIQEVPVRVASIDHLISMKRAADRTKDKLMLEEYIVIADLERDEKDSS